VSDGASEGEHRKSAAEQFRKLGIKPKYEVVIPEPIFPEALRYLWNWFLQIHQGIQGNGTTYPVVTWEAVYCWAKLTRQEPAPRDVQMIIALGNTWAVIRAEQLEKKLDAAKH
jgi:hypothetical protein